MPTHKIHNTISHHWMHWRLQIVQFHVVQVIARHMKWAKSQHTIYFFSRFIVIIISLLRSFITLIVFIEHQYTHTDMVDVMKRMTRHDQKKCKIHTLKGIQSFHATKRIILSTHQIWTDGVSIKYWRCSTKSKKKKKKNGSQTIKLDNYISQSNSISLR